MSIMFYTTYLFACANCTQHNKPHARKWRLPESDVMIQGLGASRMRGVPSFNRQISIQFHDNKLANHIRRLARISSTIWYQIWHVYEYEQTFNQLTLHPLSKLCSVLKGVIILQKYASKWCFSFWYMKIHMFITKFHWNPLGDEKVLSFWIRLKWNFTTGNKSQIPRFNWTKAEKESLEILCGHGFHPHDITFLHGLAF